MRIALLKTKVASPTGTSTQRCLQEGLEGMSVDDIRHEGRSRCRLLYAPSLPRHLIEEEAECLCKVSMQTTLGRYSARFECLT